MSSEVLVTLERACQVVQSSSANEDRKAAEQYILQLKNHTKQPLAFCQQILGQSSNDYVIFQCVSIVRESTLREWSILKEIEIETIWKYLLAFVTQKHGLPAFVTAEILQTIAMIIKRGTIDGKSGETDMFYSNMQSMITSDNSDTQALACQAFLSLCTEYCSSWRSSDVGMTWDFHIKAKRNFEAEELKNVFELCVKVLHSLMNSESLSDQSHQLLCYRFLCVSETVLSWHFGSRMLPKRLTYNVEFSSSAALRPPGNWSLIFMDRNVVTFFFQLHSKVRHNRDLCHHSLQCLIQLCSLMGEVFMKAGVAKEEAHINYVTWLVNNILNVFSNGPLAHEIMNFSIMVNKLLSYQPMASIVRMPNDLMNNFLQFLLQITCQLCKEAINEDPNYSDEFGYHESLSRLLDCWSILIGSQGRVLPERHLTPAAQQIFSAFITAILAPPTGTRATSNDDETNEMQEDDREAFKDLLVVAAMLGRHCETHAIEHINRLLNEKLSVFGCILSQKGNVDSGQLVVLLEDMHWLLMITGYLLTGEDMDGISFIPDILQELSSVGENKSIVESSRSFITATLTRPEQLPDQTNVDVIMKLIGSVFVWSVLEHRLLIDGQHSLLSPQLAQTTLWVLRRISSAYTAINQSTNTNDSPEPIVCPVRHVIETENPVSQLLVDFLLQKCFVSLRVWSGELLVARDALQLLVSMVDVKEKANQVASSGCLLDLMSSLQIDRLIPGTRKELLRSLVLIGAATDNDTLREKMYLLVLDPLAQRFHSVLSAPNEMVESDLLDLLDCLSGVALASQSHSAVFLFNYLMPMLSSSVSLLTLFKQRQTVVDGLLQLFSSVSSKLGIYLDSELDTQTLYSTLLLLLKDYANTQIGKYNKSIEDEDKANDLVIVLEILANVLSKDVLLMAALHEEKPENVACAASVTMTGLNSVMPLMTGDLLRFPSLASKFFTLLLYMTEMYPEMVLSPQTNMIHNLIKCAQLGITSEYGNEVLKISLELIGIIATYVTQSIQDANLELRDSLAQFIKPVFCLCLRSSCDVDAFSEAVFSLYSLICCHQSAYNSMVSDLISSHSSAKVKETLLKSFQTLLAPDAKINSIRQEKRQFRERFELFLSDISGLLCCNI